MNERHADLIAQEFSLTRRQVAAVLSLLEDGATIPFIARYRKEATGSLDEVALMHIRDRSKQLRDLDDRRDTILKSMEEQGFLTTELSRRIMEAGTLSGLEDIYQPYRPKRRTRATIAKERGLEPLAMRILKNQNGDSRGDAVQFVDPGKELPDVDAALAGASDIIAEMVSDDERSRSKIRRLFERAGVISTTVVRGKEEEGAKFRDYFQFEEALRKAPSHRVLAMRRAEKEGIIRMKIMPPEDKALDELDRIFLRGRGPNSDLVAGAIQDGYKRLLAPSIETEMRVAGKRRADEEAIAVFAENLRQLLLAAPLGRKTVMAVDPGFRTGCKVVVLDPQGSLLHDDVIYPHPPQNQSARAEITIEKLVDKFGVEAIAVGNGTAGRETESFLREMRLPEDVLVVMVNEAGASVYSASDVAREEFPDKDVTVRGAVSIGRRLMDPLAELVKIDPKSIGVGQYQHDVDQNLLKASLDQVVESCVNAVGVELNTASKELLTYVSGLGPQLARNIVAYRDENGPFRSRAELKKVPRLGDKAFEQCAGFLRIRGGKQPLDGSAVHPESYGVVQQMAKDLGCTVSELMSDAEKRKQIRLEKYVTDSVGMPTLKDILAELARPGRDPRQQFEVFRFAEGIDKISDLQEGMELPGIVTNITRFGAFVDVGVHQDGLVHVSQISDKYVKDPAEVVKLGQHVRVKVQEVDLRRNRISFTMKGLRP